MAQANLQNVNAGITNLPFVRQIGLAVVFAASLSLLGAIVLWAMEPSYRLLYGNLSDQEMMDVTQALEQSGIKYEINPGTSAVVVEAGRVHEARMKLAGMGLPRGSGTGYELLDKEQGFGTSQFIETARYQRAIEGELARSISSLNNVQSARVHLAIPKQSAFVRNRKKPSASVMLTLYQGRAINKNQSDAIAHMVASSVPNLEVEDVTVVDQSGRLLTQKDAGTEIGYSSSQFEYRKNLEEYYINRIQEILEPIIGVGKVRAQVVADLDFTVVEQTHESYNPDLPSIRSEQTIEEESSRGNGASGVPGALSNTPPGAGNVSGDAGNAESNASNSTRRMVRNYELDRTISHTKHQIGSIKRLSAAVVIDERMVVGEGDAPTSEPLSPEEMERIRGLVREAIGFSAARGDSVNVINAPFRLETEVAPAPETSLLDQPWIWDLVKQVAGLLVALILIFGVLKPLFKNLVEKGAAAPRGMAVAGAGAGSGGEQQLALEGGAPGVAAPRLAAPSYDQQLEVAKGVAQQEPQRVAQIVKGWVEKDG